jgi:hypothetical protein
MDTMDVPATENINKRAVPEVKAVPERVAVVPETPTTESEPPKVPFQPACAVPTNTRIPGRIKEPAGIGI